ncbi:MAG: phosphoribosyltransferase [Bacteroidia bacterium]|nr:phosphoribosyltransferase [Bacteroidia bacterium]
MTGTLILNQQQIEQKITRIAAEIMEDSFIEAEINLAGINGNGFELAKLIRTELVKLNAVCVNLFEINLNKKNLALSEISILPEKEFLGKSVVLVDDVLNSGKTFSFALASVLNKGANKIQSAVLVNRSHKNFPVLANYVGLSLTTTLEEHVSVVLTKGMLAAYLDNKTTI